MSTAATPTGGVLAWLLGVGFGLPDVFGITYFETEAFGR
jgi:hypothetical protein